MNEKNATILTDRQTEEGSRSGLMRCYNKQTFEKLGFDSILKYVARKAISEEAKEYAFEIVPQTNPQWIETRLNQIQEFKSLLEGEESFPLDGISTVAYLFKKLTVKGNWLKTDELYRFWQWLKWVDEVRRYLQNRKEELPYLNQLVNSGPFTQSIIGYISRVLDEKGNMRDDASSELANVRRELNRAGKDLRILLNRLLRRANDNNWSIEREVTIRNDRFVIPIKADARGRIPGFVQDVSQSGGTVFIEPAESLPLNNKLRELQIREQNEIIRILQEISGMIHNHIEELAGFHEVMIEIDLIRAKSLLAVELGANLPVIKENGDKVQIRQGYYPLLQLKAKENPFNVIPLDVHLSREYRIILISGPNAGGKSVSLKTVGLLQLMLQSGFLVPVHPDSEFRLFDSLFVDVGDEQSVDNDLSTYTSHLYQMRLMGDNMNENSLFLIDEFGSGTDPNLGGAIAESFLERFVRQRAFGIITTHYGNLKDYAAQTKGLVNAAMQFDTKGLKPTFTLMEGIPGRSYAFEIAKRVGVHHTIISRAKKKISSEELSSEKLLKELEKKNTELSRMVSENATKQNRLEDLVAHNEQMKLEVEANRKKILREAQLQARDIIQQANKQVEKTIREIKEQNAEREATQRLRLELKASMPEVQEMTEEEILEVSESDGSKKKKPKKNKLKKKKAIEVLAGEPIKEGDWVKMKQGKSYGKLVETQGKRGVVEADNLRLTVNLDQLVKIKEPPKQTENRGIVPKLAVRTARFELDVMGKRVEEALAEVTKMVDEARFAGLNQIRILHGKGTGVLRDAIRKHLLDMPFVKTVYDAPVEQGGSGWTICEFKTQS